MRRACGPSPLRIPQLSVDNRTQNRHKTKLAWGLQNTSPSPSLPVWQILLWADASESLNLQFWPFWPNNPFLANVSLQARKLTSSLSSIIKYPIESYRFEPSETVLRSVLSSPFPLGGSVPASRFPVHYWQSLPSHACWLEFRSSPT